MATRVTADPVVYDVAIYLPEGRRLQTRVDWPEGPARLEPALSDPWAESETLKLARVLRRGTRSSLTRWRGR